MSFHLTGTDIRIDDGHYLRARLTNENGEHVDAEIDLNHFIGNNNGRFEWDGRDFSHSAENVHFAIEGGGSVPVLRARLLNVDGEPVDADVNLAERVQNHNGAFVFV